MKRIGSYKIIREIGRGGMGAVYEAVRETENFRQRAALKVIKRGMDTDAVVSRFRHEQKILATLEHPFIARFLDGGVTEEGLPFYAMEFVEGEFINEYCTKKNLGIKEKLELFRELAAAYLKLGDVQGKQYEANISDTAGAAESYRKAASLLEAVVGAEKKTIFRQN